MKKYVLLFAIMLFPGFIFAEQHGRVFLNTGISYEMSNIPSSIIGLNLDVSVPFNPNTFIGGKVDLGVPVDDKTDSCKRISLNLYAGANYTVFDCIRFSAYPIIEYELSFNKKQNINTFYGGAGCSLELILEGLDICNLGYECIYCFKYNEPVNRWYFEIPLLSLLEILLLD